VPGGLRKRFDTAVRQLELRGVLRTPLHEYESRLNFEIGIIKQMSNSGYFLIVWDFIKYARDHGDSGGAGARIGDWVAGGLRDGDYQHRSDAERASVRKVFESRARDDAGYRRGFFARTGAAR